MNDDMLNFVKEKLEEREGISPDALARLLCAAKNERPRTVRPASHARQWTLLAASLAIVACGWLVHDNFATRREEDLTNVIALLRVADENQVAESPSLADALLSWQDAPSIVAGD